MFSNKIGIFSFGIDKISVEIETFSLVLAKFHLKLRHSLELTKLYLGIKTLVEIRKISHEIRIFTFEIGNILNSLNMD